MCKEGMCPFHPSSSDKCQGGRSKTRPESRKASAAGGNLVEGNARVVARQRRMVGCSWGRHGQNTWWQAESRKYGGGKAPYGKCG